MAHQQQIIFCTSVQKKFPNFFKNKIVLDIGSLDINGNNQYLFDDCLYIGIDLKLGKNVDFAVKGHELSLPSDSVDVIISTECFEHDQFYDLTLQNIVRMLKPGGLFLFTCATTGRVEHGTRRTTTSDAPFLEELGTWGDYYKNLEEKDIKNSIDIEKIFSEYYFSNNQETFDLYFWGIKKGTLSEKNDYSFQMSQNTLKKILKKIDHSILEQNQQLAALNERIVDKDQQISNLNTLLSDKNKKLTNANQNIAFQDQKLNLLNISIDKKDQETILLNKVIETQKDKLKDLSDQKKELENTILEIYSSTSWRSTSIFRSISQLGLYQKIKQTLKRIVNLAKFTSQHKNIIINQFKILYKDYGLWITITRVFEFIQRGGPRPISETQPFTSEPQLVLSNQLNLPIVILTTKHCYYVAYSISMALSRIGIPSEIIYQRPEGGFIDVPHFVICPQMFSSLPGFYISIQMEQSVSSRWFTSEYINTLEKSFSIFDYSITNIKYLQDKGLHWRQIYYLPVGYIPNYMQNRGTKNSTHENFDVLFYGDINNDRRRKYLDAINSKFKLKVISDTFGDELYDALSKAKLVINIHYYKSALLETTRIWECLSLNKLIISEYSSDMEEHEELLNLVDFVEIDALDSMIERISFWLKNDKLRSDKIALNKKTLEQSYFNRFDYFFYRFLLANNCMTYEEFWNIIGKNYKFDSEKICLTLPETPLRTMEFQKENQYDFKTFPGLRHYNGWVGCAMSYKFISMLAIKNNLSYLTVCEDDVLFPEKTNQHIEDIMYLLLKNPKYDVFSGMLANLHEDTKIINIHDYNGKKYVVIDRFISMVFNIYSRKLLELISSWDESNYDIENNTIDRYIEKHTNLNILTTVPFLVGHKEDQKSVLWGFQNSQYNDLIRKSEQLLIDKLANE